MQFAKEKANFEMGITFLVENEKMPTLNVPRETIWLNSVAESYGRRIRRLVYRFCDDEEILRVNREFLNHDYYTDIITFDSSVGRSVDADIVISVDTVRSNAEEMGEPFERELQRVIAHGLLHICGFKDKSPAERQEMEAAENKALELWASLS